MTDREKEAYIAGFKAGRKSLGKRFNRPKHAKQRSLRSHKLGCIVDYIDAKYDALYDWLFGISDIEIISRDYKEG